MNTLNVDAIYTILKFVSYFELDEIMICFQLTPDETTLIKRKIYNSRLTVIKLTDKTEYQIEDILHRENDLPAREYSNGDKSWFINGKLHRLDGPAFEHTNGYKAWCVNNHRHRENDLPAIEYANGDKAWYVDDKLHRLYEPAIIKVNGHKEWWVKGEPHRLDGPAVEYSDGDVEWWVNGVCIR